MLYKNNNWIVIEEQVYNLLRTHKKIIISFLLVEWIHIRAETVSVHLTLNMPGLEDTSFIFKMTYLIPDTKPSDQSNRIALEIIFSRSDCTDIHSFPIWILATVLIYIAVLSKSL